MAGPAPLKGIKVLEFAGLAPGPFAGMLLVDSGASLLRIDRPAANPSPTEDMLARHKSSISVDLKSLAGVNLVKRLVKQADVIIDPFRPGVLEKLGLGPDVLMKINQGLIYGRMTGFRRDGKYKDMAGHDINYLAVAGVLGLLGRDGQKPHPPWNILADFAGGGAMLFQGILLALVSRHFSGKGQLVEANMVDGSSYLSTFPRMALKIPLGNKGRGKNLLDGGCPWYDTYETKDGGYMSVGALEPQFFSLLIKGMGLAGQGWEEKRADVSTWDDFRQLFTRTFQSKTRAEWEKIFDGTDACCTPVLTYDELEKGQAQGTREGDQRPPVTLRDTPMLALTRGVKAADAGLLGQGAGVSGNGYEGRQLTPGEGGEETLGEWMGWKKGRDFDVERGGLVLKGKDAKL